MAAITDTEFSKLAEYIRANLGIHLKPEKRTLLTARLQGVLHQEGFSSFSDYYDYLTLGKSPNAVVTLVDRITTNHTYFMRESEHFAYFREKVLPWLFTSVKDKDLRIWCAACSTGEEAYTLAMIIDEFFGLEKTNWDTKILATDISEKVLHIAGSGVYSNERIAPLPRHWKGQYFRTHTKDSSIIVDKIRGEVVFRSFNLMDPLPFRRRFHTVFCRNVMIYFDNETKTRLVNRIYDHMEYGGYLFIGHSESLIRDATRFKYIMPAVYRKE